MNNTICDPCPYDATTGNGLLGGLVMSIVGWVIHAGTLHLRANGVNLPFFNRNENTNTDRQQV